MPTTLKNIFDNTLARLSIEETDLETIDITKIKNAINQGYMLICKTATKITATATVTAENKHITVPNECVDILSIENEFTGELQKNDYDRIENSNMVKILNPMLDDADYNIIYSKLPDRLSNDTDTIAIADFYGYVISTFALYVYMLSTKKYGGAQLLLSEFNTSLGTNYTDEQMEKITK